MVLLKDLKTTINLKETTDTELIKDIQANLVRTGYLLGPNQVDGLVGSNTLNAFARFKKDNHMRDLFLVGKGSAKVLIELPEVKQGSGKPTNGVGTITSRFGPRPSGFHHGIDIGADAGTPVFAVADGTVQRIETRCKVGDKQCGGGHGNFVYINHPGQAYQETRSAHLTSVLVKLGQTVSKGQQIGTVGNTGRSRGDHLHLEVLVNGTRVNPEHHIIII